jgi:hypothetical protein
MNGKSQITQERLYSEEKKRGRKDGIMKEVAGWQKTTEKQRQQRKAANNSKSIPGTPGRGGEAEDSITK